MKEIVLSICTILLIVSCGDDNKIEEDVDQDQRDSIESTIIDIVMATKDLDSLDMIPSLRFSSGENITYTVKQYMYQGEVKMITVEDYANDYVRGSEFYYDNGQPVFVSDYISEFDDSSEVYTEHIIFLNNNEVYQSYVKNEFNDEPIFEDTLFEKSTIDISTLDFEKPLRALHQEGEFEMYFDEFLLIEPQSYLIVENADSSINAAIFIKYGDELLDKMFEDPKAFEKKKIWVNHYFEEMNGIERMIYNGAKLRED